MPCEYCLREKGHDYRCPDYENNAVHQCSICDEGICNGEEYVKNIDGEYVHYDCFTNQSYQEMIDWLGGSVGTMDEFYGMDGE